MKAVSSTRMTGEHDNSYKLVGAAAAVFMSSVPAWVADTGTKLFFAMATAFLSAIAYRTGQLLVDAVRSKKGRDDD